MAVAKSKRTKKQKLGQFLTPRKLSKKILNSYEFNIDDKILEPSFGKGSFLFPLIDKLLRFHENKKEGLDYIFSNNIYGVEYDLEFYESFFAEVKEKYNYEIKKHNLYQSDFFLVNFDLQFNYIIGNPPFGGTFDKKIETKLDKKYGKRFGKKIKKETYSFFVVACCELLAPEGTLSFICSDTFRTINTMSGLRNFLLKKHNKVYKLSHFSEETDYGMVLLEHKNITSDIVVLDNKEYNKKDLYCFPNITFSPRPDVIKYFLGKLLSEYITCTSGMTVGKNKLFIREINDSHIIETYDFDFFNDPITLRKELEKAKNNKMSDRKKKETIQREKNKETKRNIKITKKLSPIKIKIPNKDYVYYNKSTKGILYAKPAHVIYWKDNGDAVYTFKKNGKWYLHGVGGKPHFFKSGFTWSLISSKIKPRFLPSGYVFDSGAPVGVLKEKIDENELYFIIGWLSTMKSTDILKTCLNHTRNIQSKDIERLPYPFWVSDENKTIAVAKVKNAIENKMKDKPIGDLFFDEIENLYEFVQTKDIKAKKTLDK